MKMRRRNREEEKEKQRASEDERKRREKERSIRAQDTFAQDLLCVRTRVVSPSPSSKDFLREETLDSAQPTPSHPHDLQGVRCVGPPPTPPNHTPSRTSAGLEAVVAVIVCLMYELYLHSVPGKGGGGGAGVGREKGEGGERRGQGGKQDRRPSP